MKILKRISYRGIQEIIKLNGLTMLIDEETVTVFKDKEVILEQPLLPVKEVQKHGRIFEHRSEDQKLKIRQIHTVRQVFGELRRKGYLKIDVLDYEL